MKTEYICLGEIAEFYIQNRLTTSECTDFLKAKENWSRKLPFSHTKETMNYLTYFDGYFRIVKEDRKRNWLQTVKSSEEEAKFLLVQIIYG